MILAIALVLTFLVAYMAKQKGRGPIRWFIYALILLPVAFIHLLFLKKLNVKNCRNCAEEIKEQAVICRYCHTPVEAEN